MVSSPMAGSRATAVGRNMVILSLSANSFIVQKSTMHFCLSLHLCRSYILAFSDVLTLSILPLLVLLRISISLSLLISMLFSWPTFSAARSSSFPSPSCFLPSFFFISVCVCDMWEKALQSVRKSCKVKDQYLVAISLTRWRS